ncbi:MAG: GSCFA domain-containing protein [Lunatimonas sp.]|uniref:GSCFA domain-containing protein n=1 Tax=Lunatimonas sp. TaxID=2060141 RepID=UPI00263BB3A2|nr:GSCFA domain-containing protein [Lunatimonas sp.]MCC5937680.1 GSCFA domain-containing protein [Lunatimonas sp.]
MDFRTAFPSPHYSHKLSYEKAVFSMGSCFAGLLGDRLSAGKFNVLANPFGIIYNPLSLVKLLSSCMLGEALDKQGVLTYQSRYFHYRLHSSFHAPSEELLHEQFSATSQQVMDHLTRCSHVFLTWGTAYSYEHTEWKIPVANCHKQPTAFFSKRLLHTSEMEEAFRGFQELLLRINPDVRVVVTVSPVRHIKDGIPENQLSKSTLRVLCHQLETTYGFVDYFPSYEWMMDDLRDYRFYKADMIHPSEVAEDYIWTKFSDSFMEPAVRKKYERVIKMRRSMSHRPFYPGSNEHQRFLAKLIQEMEDLQPEIDFSSEIAAIQSKMLDCGGDA